LDGHDYAQLFESAAHVSGPARQDCIRGWMDAILDRVSDQICHRVAGTENWQTFFEVKDFTDSARRLLGPKLDRIATKLAKDPNSRLTAGRRERTRSTEELLGKSLLGDHKS
jgi:hypothetical protein